eukprot:CAMPEP_0184331716 /NCGR_PEP_ID=MMETSP1089-20130417/998_1 /TAXON_ID=38269 ORGANISM="Gloeochaete wittrockiana, Strain SAG46.84" /NCGR_SAMPLE_ID=MMETSP1089 /ASSEMBLY_ACC=CAM_ASM_000445 /LENGTH=202 /DNA_ID=CAMNT_0026654773 /DNA_START=83 /DNA_END=687 /DNA_ORIENTATION=+
MADNAQINAILAGNYNLDDIPVLENFVTVQSESKSYNRDANARLLKLYQFAPERINTDVLIRVLVLAISYLPQPDFKYFVHMIPTQQQQNEAVIKVINYENFLEAARFSDFWKDVREDAIFQSIAGSTERVRLFILEMIQQTFYSIEKNQLKVALDVNDAELAALIAENNWTDKGKFVDFGIKEQTSTKTKLSFGTQFSQLS